MKNIFLFLLLFLLTVTVYSQEKKLVILHTNDMHSKLNGFAPEAEYTPFTINDDKTRGGFARITTVIEQEKNARPEEVLVLDDGDFLMGTLFHALEEETGFQLPLMKKMGYDAVSIGNHEFDFGPATLANIINQSATRGEIPSLLLSNIVFSEKSPDDDNLETVYRKGIIQPYTIIEKSGIKIGLFGILGYDAIDVAPNAAPVKFSDPVKTAKKMAHFLKDEKQVDLVILLSHSGVSKTKENTWQGEDYKIAQKAKDIDIIISGHTHSYLDKPVWVGKIPIVQTGSYGENLGRIEITLENNTIKNLHYRLIPIDDNIPGNMAIQKDIDEYKKMVEERILSPIHINYDDVLVETSFDLICDEQNNLPGSNLGPFLADALYNYVNMKDSAGTDIAMIAAGMIRDKLNTGETGKQTIADLFRIVSLGKGQDAIPGYPLSRVYVTGKELKSIVEILLIAYKSSTSNYIYYSGLKIHYNPTKGLLKKVQSIEIGNELSGYESVDFSKKNKFLYSITADSYMLQFVGMLKKMSFGLIKVVPKKNNGVALNSMKDAVIDFNPEQEGIQEGKEWIALLEFVRGLPDTNNNGIPNIPERYKEQRNPVIAVK
ncbi:MAG: bifunctional metallophosphatase/5'-nucleotidase [Bacteroidales bacterium]|nr:bifunctional metallophosphatase/5'-nucleotidase [Bacteroidales bacterium]